MSSLLHIMHFTSLQQLNCQANRIDKYRGGALSFGGYSAGPASPKYSGSAHLEYTHDCIERVCCLCAHQTAVKKPILPVC